MPDVASPPIVLRVALIVIGLAFWFATQRMINYRPRGSGTIGDGLHTLTEPLWRWFSAERRRSDVLLIVTSLGIDLFGLFLIGLILLGPTVAPFFGLLFLFGLRQVCQVLCTLPVPEGCIWRPTGVPTFLVTYDVANDLFFSGHTAMAVFGAIEVGRWGGTVWGVAAGAVAAFEALAVIVLRAHYTMDVFAGAMTAVVAVLFADAIGPTFDAWLVAVGAWL
ncbi:MAG: hypothetical protein K1X57_07615 [Gemmataceae bacterium]|nr:hypothetical protein [Gemmataceae bacterium]